MHTTFFEEIYNYPTILKEEYVAIKEAHVKIKCSKNDFMVNSGQACNEYYLIEKGIFRSSVYSYDGIDVTTGFFSDGEVLIDTSSLFQRIPAVENIQALTDGVLWKVEYQTFQELFHKIEGFREWGRTWMSNQLFISKQRSLSMITQSAAQRYLNLMEEKPQIVKEVPLKYIASYLGITDTSLSRIRKEVFRNP